MTVFYEVAARLPPRTLRWIGRLQLRSPILRRLVGEHRPNGVVTIRHGVGKGIRVLASEQSNVGYALGTTEPQVQRFLAHHLRAGDVFCDIGANVGFFTLIAARLVGETGQVYAFEPLAANVEVLRRNVELNGFRNVEVFQTAVGSQSGKGKLILGRSSLDSRLSRGDDDTSNAVEVPVISLDEAGLGRPPTMIKIDAEGSEFEVLEGMRKTLAIGPTVLCELHQEVGRGENIAAFTRSLGDVARRYDISLLEEEDNWWAPHAVALPRRVALTHGAGAQHSSVDDMKNDVTLSPALRRS